MTDFQSRIGFSPMWKIFSIGVLILILLIPLMMVRSLIDERSIRYDEAVAEISSRWGNEQSFSGPMIVVPYTEVVSRDKNGPVYAYRSAYFLPEDLKIEGALEAEKRKISIYEAVLYSVNLKVQGIPSAYGGVAQGRFGRRNHEDTLGSRLRRHRHQRYAASSRILRLNGMEQDDPFFPAQIVRSFSPQAFTAPSISTEKAERLPLSSICNCLEVGPFRLRRSVNRRT